MVDCIRGVPSRSDILGNARQRKLLRIEMKNYSHHNGNGNVLNQSSMDIDLFRTNLSDEM
jgi:hypothetical protein